MKKLFVLFFKLRGWKVDTTLPKGIEQYVVIAAPHTSNWDFIYTLAVFFSLKIPVRFLAKAELFKWPLKHMMLSFGGLAVQRSKSNNLVDIMVGLFAQNQQLKLLIPAEGTRGKVTKWKTGFYHVALKANVPVLMGFLDYEQKKAGFGPLLYLTGNPLTDANSIKDFYRNIKGKHPELFDVEALVLD